MLAEWSRRSQLMVSSAFHFTTFLLSGLAFLHRSEVTAKVTITATFKRGKGGSFIHLESIIFLAASAYLKSSLRASSLYLIRDNL